MELKPLTNFRYVKWTGLDVCISNVILVCLFSMITNPFKHNVYTSREIRKPLPIYKIDKTPLHFFWGEVCFLADMMCNMKGSNLS